MMSEGGHYDLAWMLWRLFGAGLFLVLALPLLALCFMFFRRFRRSLQPLASAVGGELERDPVGDWVLDFDYEGRSCRVAWRPAQRSFPERVTVAMAAGPRFNFIVRQEGLLGKLGKKIGWMEDFELGEPDFDRKHLISVSAAAPARAYFADPERRLALAYFFEHGFQEVRGEDGEVIAVKEVRRPDLGPLALIAELRRGHPELRPEVVRERLHHLRKLGPA